MLKALKQLEDKSPRPQQVSESVTPEQPDLHRRPPPDDAPRAAAGTAPGETAIDAALARVEIAAAAVGRQLHETASNVPTDAWPVRATARHAPAYRELAEHFLSQLPPGRPVVLMFTSPGDGEGTTETLASLAAALAEPTEQRVLLLDGNLHKPDLASCLDVQVTRGLAQVIGGDATWQQVVQTTSAPHLDLLPGVKPPAPDVPRPEHWGLRPLLDELRRHYQLILIDSASLAHAEAVRLAGYCDGTYLVVRLKHTARRELGRAVEALQECSGDLLGSVVIGS
jgi:Mrp family chromosome partitioning ATPase